MNHTAQTDSKKPPRITSQEEILAGKQERESRQGTRATGDAPPTTFLSSSIISAPQLKHLNIPKRKPLIEDWFFEKDLGLIYAPRGLGKTWLALGMATALANGTEIGCWKVHQPSKVLYLDGEMPCENIRERTTGMGAGENLFVLNHELLFNEAEEELNLADPEHQEKVSEEVARNGIKVLVIDNLSCLFSGLKENEADSWDKVLPWLLGLRRRGVSVIIVHHAGKDGVTQRGSSRREDHTSWIIRLTQCHNHSDKIPGARFISSHTKNRNGRIDPPDTEWHFTTDSHGKVEVTTKNADAGKADILLSLVQDGYTSATEIGDVMGIEKGTVSKEAYKLKSAGLIRIEKGRYLPK